MIQVISGGQTGVDRYGLEVARELGIKTGGTVPRNYYTDDGPDLSLIEFGVKESPFFGYPHRTEQNVKDSDATVLFGDLSSPGCRLTIKLCKKHGKPYFENPSPDELFSKIILYGVKVLNVAGNREKNLSKIKRQEIKDVLREGLLKVLTK